MYRNLLTQIPIRHLKTTVSHNVSKKENLPDRSRLLAEFKNAAPHYDTAIAASWFGFIPFCRKKMLQLLDPNDNTKLLDVASGTGAVALCFLDLLKKRRLKDCHVTLCDLNEHMMEVGKRNLRHYDPSLITWAKGDFHDLPFKEECFNAFTVAFGYRYSEDIGKALKEAYRVLQPGGKFLCLDCSTVEGRIPKWLFERYLYNILPLTAYVFNVHELYQFAVKTFQHFPDQKTFSGMIKEAGFQDVGYVNYLWGVVAIHHGTKK